MATATCTVCAAPLDPQAASCARCGIAAPAPAARRPPRGARLLAGITFAAALATVALPVLARIAEQDAACRPRSWRDWHVAMRGACVTPAYVCENLTASRLRRDPEVARLLDRAPTHGAIALDALVGHVRGRYGCEDAGAAGPGLPEGHPPLPPGHPDLGAGGDPGVPGAPWGTPDGDRALRERAAPRFEAPLTHTI